MKGQWVISDYQRGDIFIFDFGAGIQHMGMCLFDYHEYFMTVEGNTGSVNYSNGGAVLRQTRYPSQIAGACRPAYPSPEIREKIIAILEAEADAKVTEYPPESNNVLYNTWYYGHPVSGENYAWCVVFIAWGFYKAGAFEYFMNGRTTASCTALATYYGYGETTTTGGGTVNPKVTVTLVEIQRGDSGAQVQTLQFMLNALGYPSGIPDGEFGPKTESAVLKFQNAEDIVEDGIVGAQTWGRLLT
jgi:hypothetical protein